MENILAYLLTGGVAAAGVKLIESVVVWFLNRKAKENDDAADEAKKKKERLETEYADMVKTVESLKTANRLIMQDRIKHLCRSYLKDGEIEFSDLDDLLAMHNCYHDVLGGNGNLTALMELVKELPVKK